MSPKEKIRNIGCLVEAQTSTKVYIFGSAVRNPNTPNDFDILLILGDQGEASNVRKYFSQIKLELPIHFLVASKEEEEELDLIRRQQAISVRSW